MFLRDAEYFSENAFVFSSSDATVMGWYYNFSIVTAFFP